MASFSGCKIWDPRTWRVKPRQRTVQYSKYEMATPYAGLVTPAPPSQVFPVSGMGYGGSMAFYTADGQRMISESSPAGDATWAAPSQQSPLAGVDDQGRRERFGQSYAESSRLRGDGVGGEGAKEKAQLPPPDPFAGLPVGIPVPGKPGYVNLPDPYAGLPQIDVRGIPSGTPVEVPNPLQAGQKIRFRVP